MTMASDVVIKLAKTSKRSAARLNTTSTYYSLLGTPIPQSSEPTMIKMP